MKPSQSTVASFGIGVPTASIVAWCLQMFAGVTMPSHVEAALGALVSAIVSYFFRGGRAADTQETQ